MLDAKHMLAHTKQFETQGACNDFLENMRWPEGVECVHCASKRVTKYIRQAGTRWRINTKTGEPEVKPVLARILYVCLDCRRQFSVTQGSIFDNSHLPLEKWFHAITLMVSAKRGVSALQLKRDVGTTYKTAWYLRLRVRKAMALIELADEESLTDTTEADEVYLGSKTYNRGDEGPKYGKESVQGNIHRVSKERFEAVVHALLKTPPMPASDIPRKREPKAKRTPKKR